MSAALQLLAGSSINEPVAPFPRLCQASLMMGRALSHLFGAEFPSESAEFEAASQLYTEASDLARKITEEAEALPVPQLLPSVPYALFVNDIPA
jgi:hypothetical protein